MIRLFLIFAIVVNPSSLFGQTNWMLFTKTNSSLPTNYITEIKADRKGNIWAAGRLYLAKYDGNTWTSWNLDTLVPGFAYIHDIDFDNNNNVWLATSAGVIRFDGNHSWIELNPSNSGITFELPYSIEVCPNGNIWCGDVNSERVAKLIGSHWITYAIPGLGSGTGNSVYSIDSYLDQVWFSWGGYLIRYDNTGWTKYDPPPSNGFIGDVHVDSTGTLWTTQTRDPYTLASGLLIGYDGTHWIEFDSSNCSTLLNGVYTSAIDSGAIWLGSVTEGVTRFDGINSVNFNKSNSVLPSNRILDIDIDKNRNILIGTDSGLVIYNEKGIKIGYSQPLRPEEIFELNVYPNPASDLLTLTWNNTFTQPTISLYSMYGQLVYTQQYQQPPAILDSKHFANGIYEVSFQSGRMTVNRKLVIQH